MKCRVCGKPASLSLRAYNTALCADDFIAFLEKRVLQTIRRYKLINTGERPLVAVSGGKDSLALWTILNRLGFAADGMYIDLGIAEYSQTSYLKARAMADELNRRLFRFSIPKVFGKEVAELSRITRRPPCSLCGTVKRYAMNRVCVTEGYSVLLTGHNLDDEASALLGNILYWKEEYLWKKDVVLEGQGSSLAKKAKPFFLCSEREVAAYALLKGIDYVYEECPYAVGARTLVYKNVLNQIEEMSPATKIMFLKGYLKRLRSEPKREQATSCIACGYPTYTEKCNFCSLMDRVGGDQRFAVDTYDPAETRMEPGETRPDNHA
ncbi:MAG TPA: TIGR00269 family protein [Deltaproteobacteria bacterium]|nr:TIGR00269 family protein [Deltaproteobacteria bacterium]